MDRTLIAVTMLVIFTLSLLPAPTQASHWDPFIEPNVGMVVDVPSAYGGNLTFDEGIDLLSGYHEWREHWTVERESGGTLFFDATTNHWLGWGDLDEDHTARKPTIPHPLAPDFPELTNETEQRVYSDYAGTGYYPGLPESLLWGRSAWTDDTWEVPLEQSWWDTLYGYERSLTVSLERDWPSPEVNVTVHVEWHKDDILRYDTEWDLGFNASRGPFAEDRLRTVRSFDANGTVISKHGPESFPVTVHAEGDGPHQDYDGLSHIDPYPGPDRRLSYDTLGALPHDPEPHAFFDIHQAATHAEALDDPAWGSFWARADDPMLLKASVYLDASHVAGQRLAEDEMRQASWYLAWADANGTHLGVTLRGTKIADGPFLVTHGDARFRQGDRPAPSLEARALTVTGDPGTLARNLDAALAEHDATAYRYDWEVDALDWFPDEDTVIPATVTFGGAFGDYFRSPTDFEEVTGWSSTDATTGLVHWSAYDHERTTVLGREVRPL